MLSEKEYIETFGFPSATQYPKLPVPKPATIDDILPEVSEEKEITRKPAGDVMVYIAWWGGWVPTSALKKWPYVQHPFPQNVQLKYSIFWKRIETIKLAPGEQLTKSWTVKNGMTVTDTSSFAAELGVSVEGLSAKLTTTLTHTVSVMTETDVTTAFNYTAKKSAVWTLWQLYERFSFVDEAGKLVEWASDADQPGPLGTSRVRLNLVRPFVVSRPPNTMYPDAKVF
jgi:hypothetical protein